MDVKIRFESIAAKCVYAKHSCAAPQAVPQIIAAAFSPAPHPARREEARAAHPARPDHASAAGLRGADCRADFPPAARWASPATRAESPAARRGFEKIVLSHRDLAVFADVGTAACRGGHRHLDRTDHLAGRVPVFGLRGDDFQHADIRILRGVPPRFRPRAP